MVLGATLGTEVQLNTKLKACIYGPPKTVKTPLAVAIIQYLRIALNKPKLKGAYFAADLGSEDLPSIPEAWLDSIIRIAQYPDPKRKPTDVGGSIDPYEDATMFSLTDWRDPKNGGDPDCEVLIWDTYTSSMEDILQWNADQGYFASEKTGDKHVVFGEPGSPARLAVPVMGDYRGMSGIGWRLLKNCMAKDMYFILICHERPGIKDENKHTKTGPACVGEKLVSRISGAFNMMMFTEKASAGDGRSNLIVHTESDGVHLAGVRHRTIDGSPVNPIPTIKVSGNTEDDLIKVWDLIFRTFDLTSTPKEMEGAIK